MTQVPDQTSTDEVSPSDESTIPDNLDELFSRDPLSLSDDDIETIVRVQRSKRHLWAQQEITKAAKPKRVPKAKKGDQPPLNLDDLEIEI